MRPRSNAIRAVPQCDYGLCSGWAMTPKHIRQRRRTMNEGEARSAETPWRCPRRRCPDERACGGRILAAARTVACRTDVDAHPRGQGAEVRAADQSDRSPGRAIG